MLYLFCYYQYPYIKLCLEGQIAEQSNQNLEEFRIMTSHQPN